jgi:hypothetical protein
MTPAAIHYGQAQELHAPRARVLDAAYERYPERFDRKRPSPPELATAAWINSPPRRRSLTKNDPTRLSSLTGSVPRSAGDSGLAASARPGPAQRGKRASADDRIRPRPPGRPATALATQDEFGFA